MTITRTSTMAPAAQRPVSIHPTVRCLLLLLLVLIVTAGGCGGGGDDGRRLVPVLPSGATATGDAMVVTDDPLASEAAAAVLAAGGNAVDATIAASLALAVVRPEAGNLGGGGFMLVCMADAAPVMIDCRESAPAAATRDMFLDAAGEPDPERSRASGLAVGVPGTVAGLALAHDRFGSRPWPTLIEPAIELAAGGFPVGERLAALLADSTLAARLGRSDASARLFLRGGEHPYTAGERLVQPELAATLRRIASHGAPGFYTGPVATALADEVAAWGGRITVDDLAAYRAVERQPVIGQHAGYEVVSASPPAAGGIVLLLELGMVAALETRRMASGDLEPATSPHFLAEIMRRAYALRSSLIGDPDQVEVPQAALTDPALARALAADIDPLRATPSSALEISRAHAATAGGEGTETTHLVVIDANGNAVSSTTSLNAYFGTGILVTGHGFLLNNTMDDFATKPGAPNLYGLVQGEQNAVAPGKRPLSSMTPTVLRRDGRSVMALGSPGGSRITHAVLQVLLNQLELGLGPEAAVRRPRIHHQFLPDTLFFEEGAVDTPARARLEAAGHTLVEAPWAIGQVHLAVRRADGRWDGVADPRRGGTALGLDRR
jgi:gamma-glutamyltranspeptidase/glutathione hydrolase